MDFSDPVDTVRVPTETLPLADWVWPVPDNAIDPVDVTIRKDTIRLAFIAALQTLPPRQRAVIILQDVYRWPASQTANVLGTSITAVNSALQRARLTLSRANLKSEALNVIDGELNQGLIDRYVDAFERYDIDALLELFHEDGSISMPPFVMWISGLVNLATFYEITRSHCVGSRLLPTRVNGTVALAQYARDKLNERLVPWGIHVPEIRGNRIIHVHTFIDPALYTLLEMPTDVNLTN
jgi:RNA polymerase sigma-70 factor (ECF subfamily)